MKSNWKAVTAGTVVTAIALAPTAAAETRIDLGGARPISAVVSQTLQPLLGGMTPEQYTAFTPHIGENWLPGTTPDPVDYPATGGPLIWGKGSPYIDQSVTIGQQNLDQEITTQTANGPLVVAGLSMGALVEDQEMRYLATDPNAPPPDQLRFVEFGNPARGVLRALPVGVRFPVFGYTPQPVPESQYNVDVVNGEYDGWTDPPDRPWNLVADANAIMGAGYYAHTKSSLSYKQDAVVLSQTTNSWGGTTTTYLAPTKELPLTQPLRKAGVPNDVVDKIDKVVRPVVDAGYSRNDPPKNTTPVSKPKVNPLKRLKHVPTP